MSRPSSLRGACMLFAAGVLAFILIYRPGAMMGSGWAVLLAMSLLASVTLERDQSVLPNEREAGRAVISERDRRRRVLIIGAGAVGQALARSLERQQGCHVVGFLDDEREMASRGDWPVLGGRGRAAEVVRDCQVDEVFLAYVPTWQQQLVEELAADLPRVAVQVVPSPYEALMRLGRVENRGDIAVVRLSEPHGRVWDSAKRLLDIAGAVLLLALTLPITLLVALLIRRTSPGPVFFTQERVGRFGRLFTLYKFRTMVPGAEEKTGPVLSDGRDDPRVTPLGRWLRMLRLDELPQLWNVVRGEMSLVGPRPERPVFVRRFEAQNPLYAMRHEVRPGITGLAQVCGGYRTDARDKLRFDLIYISQRSLWLDLKILLRTVLVVISSRGS